MSRKPSIRVMISVVLLCVLLSPKVLSAENRGFVPVPIKNNVGKQVGLYKESHALVIGVSEYIDGWPKLPGVKSDIDEVRKTLETVGFKVRVVMDPTREQLGKAFTDFINEYGLEENNRLIFYYAGHGHTLKFKDGRDMGYIIPADTPVHNKNEKGFFKFAMDMQQIEVYAKRIQSKHALFMFDSCFSGSLFALSRAIPELIQEKTSLSVRQFITAGTANQEVPDESLFRRMFVKALQGDGDLNKDGYVTGTELGLYLEDKVASYSHNSQTPKYGKIRDPILDQGDFVFPLQAARLGVGNFAALPEKTPSDPGANDFERQRIDNERRQLESEKQKLEEEKKSLAERRRMNEEKNQLAEERKRQELQVAKAEPPPDTGRYLYNCSLGMQEKFDLVSHLVTKSITWLPFGDGTTYRFSEENGVFLWTDPQLFTQNIRTGITTPGALFSVRRSKLQDKPC